MNEKVARPRRISPTIVSPMMYEPIVEKSVRITSPKSSPTLPPSGMAPNAVARGKATSASAARMKTTTTLPAMRVTPAIDGRPLSSGAARSVSSMGTSHATTPIASTPARASSAPHRADPVGADELRPHRVAAEGPQREGREQRRGEEHQGGRLPGVAVGRPPHAPPSSGQQRGPAPPRGLRPAGHDAVRKGEGALPTLSYLRALPPAGQVPRGGREPGPWPASPAPGRAPARKNFEPSAP